MLYARSLALASVVAVGDVRFGAKFLIPVFLLLLARPPTSYHHAVPSPSVPSDIAGLHPYKLSYKAPCLGALPPWRKSSEDDTDLPLPNKPLPNPGAQGALIEELDTSEDENDTPTLLDPRAGPASPSFPQSRPGSGGEAGNTVTDITLHNTYVLPSCVQISLCRARVRRWQQLDCNSRWTCIYPISIDVKRPGGKGERRIARSKGVWWPFSKDIVDATNV